MFKKLLLVILVTVALAQAVTALSSTGLVSYYAYSGNANDAVGGCNGTVTGAVNGNVGIIPPAYTYTGDDYIAYPDSCTQTLGKGVISFWANMTSAPARYFTYSDVADGTRYMESYTSAAAPQLIKLELWGGSALYTIYMNVTNRITNGSMHMISWVSNGTKTSGYFDGIEQPIILQAGTNNGQLFANISTNAELLTGVQKEAGVLYEYYKNGTIDEFSVWSRALNATEVAELYNNGSGLAYPFATPSTNFTVTATNNFNSSAITVFNLSISSGATSYFYSTSTGTITTGVLSNSTELWNISIASENHWNATRNNFNVSVGSLSLGMDQYPFIMISDYYNGSILSTFNATISSVTYSTSGQQLYVPINSTSTTAVTLAKENYLDRVVSFVLTNNGNQNSSLWQYQLNVSAADAVTGSLISSFTFAIPLFSATGNSSTPLPVRVNVGSFTANVSATGYQPTTFTFTSTPAASLDVVLNLSPYVNFSLIREQTNTAFNVSATTSTKITVLCPVGSTEYTVTNASPSFAINCSWTFMKIDVAYTSSSYYRTLIPSTSERTIKWYLIDLNLDLANQVLLQLNDLTGQFSNGYASIKKVIAGSEVNIIQQYWDISNIVDAYLIANGLYTLSVTDDEGNVRSIGYLIADTSGTKTITIPSIVFVPEQGVGSLINWDWDDAGLSVIRLQYNDTSPVHTSSLVFAVYNGTNINQVLYTTTETNVTYASLSYGINTNLSYLACFNATNPTYGLQSECKTFEGKIDLWDTSDWDAETADEIKGWASIIFLVSIFLGIAYFDSLIAMAMVAFFMWVFMHWNWLTFGNVYVDYMVLSLFVVLTVLDFLWRGMR